MVVDLGLLPRAPADQPDLHGRGQQQPGVPTTVRSMADHRSPHLRVGRQRRGERAQRPQIDLARLVAEALLRHGRHRRRPGGQRRLGERRQIGEQRRFSEQRRMQQRHRISRRYGPAAGPRRWSSTASTLSRMAPHVPSGRAIGHRALGVDRFSADRGASGRDGEPVVQQPRLTWGVVGRRAVLGGRGSGPGESGGREGSRCGSCSAARPARHWRGVAPPGASWHQEHTGDGGDPHGHVRRMRSRRQAPRSWSGSSAARVRCRAGRVPGRPDAVRRLAAGRPRTATQPRLVQAALTERPRSVTRSRCRRRRIAAMPTLYDGPAANGTSRRTVRGAWRGATGVAATWHTALSVMAFGGGGAAEERDVGGFPGPDPSSRAAVGERARWA
ncbi:hypothetical protein FAIPA1_130109 [Frankia sp. AiPs1]